MDINTTEPQQPKMTKETGQFNNNWRKAAYYMECLSKVAQTTQGFPFKEIWQTVFDDHTWDEREKLIKDKKRRETKKQAKFAPKNLVKPSNVQNRFRAEFRAKCTLTGVEYKNEDFVAAFKALTADDKARLEAAYRADMDAYKRAEAEQLALAIQSGEYPEPKPKANLTEYMLFSNECRKPGNKFLTAEEHQQLATAPIQEQAHIISTAFNKVKTDAEAMAPIRALAVSEKARYARELHQWKIRALERQITKITREGGDSTSVATELETLRSNPPAESAVAAAPVAVSAPASAQAVAPAPAVGTTETAPVAKLKAPRAKPAAK